jgi:hypothetical protein
MIELYRCVWKDKQSLGLYEGALKPEALDIAKQHGILSVHSHGKSTCTNLYQNINEKSE